MFDDVRREVSGISRRRSTTVVNDNDDMPRAADDATLASSDIRPVCLGVLLACARTFCRQA